MNTIAQIIRAAGTEDEIATASELYVRPGEGIKENSAIRKWRATGIPVRWYRLMADLSGRTIQEIHEANERVWAKSGHMRATGPRARKAA